MKQSLDKLSKILKLEAERGFDNRAVVGGLNRILDTWELEARLDGLPDDLIEAIGARLRDYPGLSETSRSEALQGLWRRLQREGISEPLPKPAASPEKENQSARAEKVETASIPDRQAAAVKSVEPEKPPQVSPTPETPAAKEIELEPAALNASVTVLQNVGPKHAHTLSRLGLLTLRDMLYYFPRRYDDYASLMPINRLSYGEEVTVIGTVQSVTSRPIRSGQLQIVEAVVNDGTGAMRITWFNQPWVAKRLRSGIPVAFSGKVDQYLGRVVMNNPELEHIDQQQLSTNRIVPVYPLTAQITQRWMRRLMHPVISHYAPRLPDPLPENLRRSASLVDLTTALLQIHFPDSMDQLKAARHRLAFDEVFLLQLGVLRQKHDWQARTGRVFAVEDEWLNAQISRLPFELTGAQQRAVSEIRLDLASGHPMNRLLQGDVGSGKTAVAALAIAIVTSQGAQAALMAPTSILAEQHYQNMLNTLASSQDQSSPPLLQESQVRLMIGSTPEAEKRLIREGLADGSIKLVIGTHALLEDPVTFKELQFAIVDEQHRFGVEQRLTLRLKGDNPHLLVMTATPIPRSLALTVYGDLDLTVMDEMPAGRQTVGTFVLMPLERERAYRLIDSQIQSGRQAFIIYPLVEESDKSEARAAVEEHARLQAEVFPQYSLGLLHGRLHPDEKEDVMRRFHHGEYHALVSTSVVEVGVDVPNATVMLIEGANHFGLAQLHQFRGRVGRGADKAYCLLIPDSADQAENERLQVMAQTNDGFVLAEKDLDQRGPGEFLGTRQSGYTTQLQLASLTDVRLIEKARQHAQAMFKLDPELALPEHQLLAAALERFWDFHRCDVS
ncbi:MAG TPA: ATP-dependent DNA helicase RecG [Anaerolineales bacterium]|nr:ATP-dependent DNA helicase RecG [Anaerolineales bacterium]